ncbi:PREDICTED: uncharacterized protein LOC108567841 [Nicrophorus vespilloides]|uniref:Uncharacterized protein LOC108567841 n=1 Tax=Nicrophorus vespilloides TaxID=110193 RepID=A0ABM1NB28_NICVS|nr:PREDICTED: uncharacterized protein LOC108567841 [Nicrophorus vespilloides]
MNSKEDLEVKEEVLMSPDTNANVSNDHSKGAIPKKIKSPLQKKTRKLNNNLDNLSTLNSEENRKMNGITSYINLQLQDEPSCSNFQNYCKFNTEDSSSSDENDILSVSDDGCIYTYKADLPSSFFALEIPPEPEPVIIPAREETSSPEMDYLEMDFDPGNNGEVDTSSETDKVEENDVLEVEPTPCPSNSVNQENYENLVNESAEEYHEHESDVSISVNKDDPIMPWSCNEAQRTKSLRFRFSKRSRSELSSPNENVPFIKGALVQNKNESDDEFVNNITDAMIWSSNDAVLKQGNNTSSAITAVMNVLNALRFPLPPIDKIKECMTERVKKPGALSLCEYLLTRSVAETTQEEIIEGLTKLSNGNIYARFFHMYPERIVNLYKWLEFWIKNGAVPIATLNLQRCLGCIPDTWHHQMIYGVDKNGVYLTNPLEYVDAGLLWPQLCSESVLLIKREDILSRWNFRTDLPELMQIKDIRWRRINVVGQVANMIHESNRELKPGFTNTSHIRIPSSQSSGITLAAPINSTAYALLKQCRELPFLDPAEANNTLTYSYY